MTADTVSPVRERAGKKAWLALAILVLPTWLLGLDVGVLHLAAPQLNADLQPSSTQLLWILDIYGFMIAGFLVTMGTLGDRIGRRRLLLVGAVAFAIASVIAAYSVNAEMLIVSRALLGVAGATLMPSTLALISNIFANPGQRTLAIGVWLVNFMSGIALGPVVGGVMLEFFWWGSVFLLGVPIMVLLLVLGPILLPEYRDENAGKLDLPSVGLSLAAFLPLIYAMKEFAKSGFELQTLLILAVGVVMAWVFVRRQKSLTSPLLDLTLFKNRSLSAALSVHLIVHIAFSFLMVLLQYFQLVGGFSALQAGLLILPGLAGNIVMSMLAPFLVRYIRPATVIVASLLMAVVGFYLYTTASPDGGVSVLVVGSIFMFVGVAPAMVLGTDLVVSSAPPNRAGSAASLAETGAELGIGLGIAIFGSILTAVYTAQMAGVDLPSDVGEQARESLPQAHNAVEGMSSGVAEQVLEPAREAFASGLGTSSWIMILPVLIAAAVAAVALRHVRKSR